LASRKSPALQIDAVTPSDYLQLMPLLTTQQLNRLYDAFRDTEVTFNRQVIAASGLMPADIHLKIADQHLPCVLYSCSLRGARVIADVGDKTIAPHLRVNSMLSLRLSFRPPEEPQEEKKVLLKLAKCELKDDMVLNGNIQKINGYFAAQSTAR
jgi:hypothetical protein